MAGAIEIAVDNEFFFFCVEIMNEFFVWRRKVLASTDPYRPVGNVEILPRFSMGVEVQCSGFAKLAIFLQLIYL